MTEATCVALLRKGHLLDGDPSSGEPWYLQNPLSVRDIDSVPDVPAKVVRALIARGVVERGDSEHTYRISRKALRDHPV